MAEFVNYKVRVTQHNGSTSTGTITHVDELLISLVGDSGHLQIASGLIADLKVLQLPPDLVKGQKNSRKKPESSVPEPLLDDAIVFAKLANSPASHTPRSHASRATTPRISHPKNNENDANWSGAAAPDFDFAANLAMFDKKQVFAEIQKSDNVSLHDRLVGHNKAETSRDKYANDEMILETKKTDSWDLIGNTSALQSRSNSLMAISKESKSYRLISESGNTVAVSSPLQLLEIERLAADYGATSSLLTEVCASHLFELITKNILGGPTRLSNRKNHNLPPLVVLLVGSGRCGARAFATGRHLTNHGVRVLAYVVPEENDEEVTSQWLLFEKVGGKVVNSSASEFLSVLGGLDTPVELIIDALQGYDGHLEDIFYQEKALNQLQQLLEWANEPKQRSKVMSLDIPAGIDGGLGTVSDENLKLVGKWVVSMGLPIAGLVHAYKNGTLTHEDVIHYLVDVGIPNKVYSSKGSLRKFDKCWHTAESVIKVTVSGE